MWLQFEIFSPVGWVVVGGSRTVPYSLIVRTWGCFFSAFSLGRPPGGQFLALCHLMRHLVNYRNTGKTPWSDALDFRFQFFLHQTKGNVYCIVFLCSLATRCPWSRKSLRLCTMQRYISWEIPPPTRNIRRCPLREQFWKNRMGKRAKMLKKRKRGIVRKHGC